MPLDFPVNTEREFIRSLYNNAQRAFTKVQERDDIAIYAQQACRQYLIRLAFERQNSDIFDRTLPRKGLWLRVIDGHSNQWVQGKQHL